MKSWDTNVFVRCGISLPSPDTRRVRHGAAASRGEELVGVLSFSPHLIASQHLDRGLSPPERTVPGRRCCVWGGRGQTAVSTRGGGTKGKIIRGGGLDGSPYTHLKLGGPAGDPGPWIEDERTARDPSFPRGGVNFGDQVSHLLLALPTHTQDTSSARHHHHRFSEYSSPHRTVRALRPPWRPFCIRRRRVFPSTRVFPRF